MSLYSTTILQDSPLAYLRLGELTGTVAADSTGNGHTGAASAAMSGRAGAIAADNDAAIDTNALYIEIPDDPAFHFAAGSWTVEAWVYPRSFSNYPAIVAKNGRDLGIQTGLRCFISNTGNPRIFPGDDGIVTAPYPQSTLAVPTGQWSYVAFGYDAAAGKAIYAVNGACEALAAANVSATNAVPIRIGIDASGVYAFDGLVDEMAIYGAALSPARLLAHYLAGITRPPAAPVIGSALIRG